MFVYYNFTQSQFQGLDYVIVRDDGLRLIMLPHGSKEGRMFDRANNEVSEDFVLRIAAIIREAVAKRDNFSEEDMQIAAAPCYPNLVRTKVESLEIMGDWDSYTWASPDAIDMSFIIKSHECSVRPNSSDC